VWVRAYGGGDGGGGGGGGGGGTKAKVMIIHGEKWSHLGNKHAPGHSLGICCVHPCARTY